MSQATTFDESFPVPAEPAPAETADSAAVARNSPEWEAGMARLKAKLARKRPFWREQIDDLENNGAFLLALYMSLNRLREGRFLLPSLTRSGPLGDAFCRLVATSHIPTREAFAGFTLWRIITPSDLCAFMPKDFQARRRRRILWASTLAAILAIVFAGLYPKIILSTILEVAKYFKLKYLDIIAGCALAIIIPFLAVLFFLKKVPFNDYGNSINYVAPLVSYRWTWKSFVFCLCENAIFLFTFVVLEVSSLFLMHFFNGVLSMGFMIFFHTSFAISLAFVCAPFIFFGLKIWEVDKLDALAEEWRAVVTEKYG